MIRRLVLACAFVLASVFALAAPAIASGGATLFGDATRVHPGNDSRTAVQLSSVGGSFGGVDFKIPENLTFGQISNLATDYNFTTGTCGIGSPRFSINVDGKNAFVYIGPPPNYTGCTPGWQTTGNLATPVSFVDTSQLPGGTFYDTFAAADIKYGGDAVTGIQLVSDNANQTVLIDNVQINGTTYTFNGQG